jgi:hypothetical protein
MEMSLLTNPSFEEGYYYQDHIPQLAVPEGWQLYYIDRDTFPGCGNPPAFRPESVVWHVKDAPEKEREVFFLDGDYCLKIFKAHAPVYFALTQIPPELTPGQRYRFTAHVYPDMVRAYAGSRKVPPSDIWHAEARLGWSDPDTPWPRARDGDVNWTKWFNRHNENLEIGVYNVLTQEFVAPEGGQVRLWLECKAKWGDSENNWFLDDFSLDPVMSVPLEHDVDSPTEVRPGAARGAPRIQYKRTYVLLPRDLSPRMVVAALRVAYENRVTAGFSPDDAGLGDLDVRRVICVNPEQTDLRVSQAWYAEYYPGATFVPLRATDHRALTVQLRQVLQTEPSGSGDASADSDSDGQDAS